MPDHIFKKPLFGKEIEITIRDTFDWIVEETLEKTYKEARRLEKIFNFYDPSSELSILNTQRKLQVSSELLEVIKNGLEFSKITNGKYDISLGKRFQKRKKGEGDIVLNVSYKDIKIHGNEVTLNHQDVLIDLSSIAKGYIVDKTTEYLTLHGISRGIVNGRGDIRIFGEDAETIGIEHPRKKGEIIKSIKLKDLSVATSGDYKQYSGSFDNSHIINARDAISVTVVFSDLMTADLFATVLFVINKNEREKLLKNYPDVKALIIDKNINLNYYNGFEDLVI